MMNNQPDTPKTPLASALLTMRSSLRRAYRRSFSVFCRFFGHDYWISLDAPSHGPLLFTCQVCHHTILMHKEEGDLLPQPWDAGDAKWEPASGKNIKWMPPYE